MRANTRKATSHFAVMELGRTPPPPLALGGFLVSGGKTTDGKSIGKQPDSPHLDTSLDVMNSRKYAGTLI